ncbi:TPA: hypothetical protein WI687_000134 [Neisseria meningitidis]
MSNSYNEAFELTRLILQTRPDLLVKQADDDKSAMESAQRVVQFAVTVSDRLDDWKRHMSQSS